MTDIVRLPEGYVLPHMWRELPDGGREYVRPLCSHWDDYGYGPEVDCMAGAVYGMLDPDPEPWRPRTGMRTRREHLTL